MDMSDQKGQTMVEYLLLLAVSISLVMTFVNSNFFRSTFGSEGRLAKKIKREYQWGYRHAYMSMTDDEDVPRDLQNARSHPSYYEIGDGGGTHFFGARSPYPQ